MSQQAEEPSGSSSSSEAPKRSTNPYEASAAKRTKTNDKDDILDYARCLELVPGNRLKVQWEIEKENGESLTHWWGATLMEYDGRSHDGVAIRTLEYDEYAEGGFPEKSKEDVIFIADDTLVNFPSEEELSFKLLADDDSEVLLCSSSEQVERIVDDMLASALNKLSAQFNALPRSRQLAIADTVTSKKAKLLGLIRDHLSTNRVLTEQNVRDLMAQTVSDS